MKIRYEFATGEVSEVEVSEELGRAIADMTHRTALRDRAETRRHVSLERLLALGAQISDDQTGTDDLAEQAIITAAVLRALESLNSQQKMLIWKVYYEGRTCRSIAYEEGVHPATITHRLQRIYQILRKELE